eukprot:2887801-Amphidinium_carterae.1
MLAKVVDKELNVQHRLFDLQEIVGKTSLEKAARMDAGIHAFCRGRANAMEALRGRIIAYCTDGEPAEMLAPQVAKAKGVLPNLQLQWRCSLHAAQRSLEAAVSRSEASPEVPGSLNLGSELKSL